MVERWMLYALIGSNIVAVTMLAASARWPNAGRLAFVLLFLWAGAWNLRTAIVEPLVYLDYGSLTVSDAYRDFIRGPFARHVTPIVSAIALGQLAIAVLVALRGAAVRLGLLGAIVFLLAIAPLGVGSGFPATLIMTLAAVVLLRRRHAALWMALPRRRLVPARIPRRSP
jgi:hypothetical protein